MRTMTIKEYENWYPEDTMFVVGDIDGEMVYLHDFIMNPPAGCKVIHKNKDALDNRRENLEIVRIVR